MFDWDERELNPEQAEAVRNNGSVMLVACPGSGKTRTLTYKIAYELSRLQSDRQIIVAITYTHRAAEEIQERVEDLGIDTSQLWIGTIHSFCLEWILKPYGIYAPDLAHGFRVIDLHEKERLLERLCEPYSNPRITIYDCEYYFTDTGYLLACPDERKHPSLHLILRTYFQELTQNHLIDFELMLWHAHKLIERLPEIGSVLAKLFPFILVDEYQDTKHIQYAIIGSVLRGGNGQTKLFIVGDPNQSIFGSLGGYPMPIDELRALCQIEIEALELSGNYRSSERIIEFFGNFNVHATTIAAVGTGRVYPSLVTYNDRVASGELAAELARLIRYNVEVLGIPPHEICVVAPQWFHLATMTRRLVVALPEYQFDGPGMVPFARDPENFWFKLARIALVDPSPHMYSRRMRWAGEILAGLSDAGVEMASMSRKLFLRECNSISILEDEGLEFLRKFFDELFRRLKVSYEDYSQLAIPHNAFFESSAARIARIQAEGLEGIGNIRFFRKVFQNSNGVTVSTIHGVKGAEFDVVIAYALLEGMVPHFMDPNGDESAQKLLYVIGSRARKNLHLFSETGRARGRTNMYRATTKLAMCEFDYNTV